MPRIEQDFLVATVGPDPERINLIRHFYSQFDYRTTAGINRRITNVEPLNYYGAIAGTEFLTYAATKLYICFDISFGLLPFLNASGPYIAFYNEANAISMYLTFLSVTWDTTAAAGRYAAYSANHFKNHYFSRIVNNQYAYIYFNGYRVTLN